MKFNEVIDRNIRRLVTNVTYKNDPVALSKAIVEKQKINLSGKDDYLVGVVSQAHFDVFYKKIIQSQDMDYLYIEVEVKITCMMNAKVRNQYDFTNEDIEAFVKENEKIIFAGVANQVVTLVANLTSPFGNTPLVFPPTIKFE